jgi:hypothetical protein
MQASWPHACITVTALPSQQCAWFAACRSKPPQAFYRTVKLPEGFHTTVYLPSSSGITQPVNTAACCSTAKASKNAAALEALRQLWAAGRLDPWLQPKLQ